MTDMNFEDYTKMMIAGGRSPEGQRSIAANRQDEEGSH
jgi:protocatechuate 4,5-dioxygenase alpha chain